MPARLASGPLDERCSSMTSSPDARFAGDQDPHGATARRRGAASTSSSPGRRGCSRSQTARSRSGVRQRAGCVRARRRAALDFGLPCRRGRRETGPLGGPVVAHRPAEPRRGRSWPKPRPVTRRSCTAPSTRTTPGSRATRRRTARWSPTCAQLATARLGGRSGPGPGTSSAASCCPATGWTRCVDPASPVPGAVPAGRARPLRRRGARRRDHHRDRPGRRPRVRDRRQRRHRQGRHLLPDDGEEAPARAGGGAAEPAAVHLPRRLRRRVPARCRTRCSPTASTSAGSSTTRRTMSGPGIPQIAAVLGSCTAGGAYVPGDERRGGDRPQPGHDLPRRPAAGEGGHRRGRHRRGAGRRRPARPRLRRHRPPRRRRRARAAASSATSSPPSARARPGRGTCAPTEPPPCDPDELYGVVPVRLRAPPTTCAR